MRRSQGPARKIAIRKAQELLKQPTIPKNRISELMRPGSVLVLFKLNYEIFI
jgi:hypothetical protein